MDDKIKKEDEEEQEVNEKMMKGRLKDSLC
jgi:hypothetical protein